MQGHMSAKSNDENRTERTDRSEPAYATADDDVPPELYGWFVDCGELVMVVRGP